MDGENSINSPKPTRDEFMAILWERINDESLSHHNSTLRYMEMFAKYNGWDKHDSLTENMNITFRIGDCEACKKAGRETNKERWEREGQSTVWET